MNPTNQTVVFYLESANTEWKECRLDSNESGTFDGAKGDSWFNIKVYTGDHLVAYRLDAGKRHYFERNSQGLLDVYEISPR